MQILLITCSPNKDSLTAACSEVAEQGIKDGKEVPIVVRLNALKISKCEACKNGWGSCQGKGICQLKDDFQGLHKQNKLPRSRADEVLHSKDILFAAELRGIRPIEIKAADGFVLISPVYWWELSESAKTLFDRLLRCEAMKDNNSVKGKPFICIAAAGGTGVGTINCLASMERMLLHLNNLQFFDLSKAICDFIGITQKNRSYMLNAVREVTKNMVMNNQN